MSDSRMALSLFSCKQPMSARQAEFFMAGAICLIALIIMGVGLGLYGLDQSRDVNPHNRHAVHEVKVKFFFEMTFVVMSFPFFACGFIKFMQGINTRPIDLGVQALPTPAIDILYPTGTDSVVDVDDEERGLLNAVVRSKIDYGSRSLRRSL